MLLNKNFILIRVTLAIVFLNVTSSSFTSDPPFYSQNYASVPAARSLVIDEVGDILISTQKSEGKVYRLYEVQNETDGSVEIFQDVLLDGVDLEIQHGLAYNQGYLYVSSSPMVYRWAYQPGQRKRLDVKDGQVVITNIPSGGIHASRTIIFDSENLLYVQVGAMDDIDPDSSRAKIRRFDLGDIPDGGIDFSTGEVFADGVRNHVGLAFDLTGVLWGVENSVNVPDRPDLGVDIWQTNPAEELNRFDQPLGTHYGYPYCFSSYLIENYTSNTQFAYPDFMLGEQIYSDDWCRVAANNQPPALAMPAHTAPLGIEFYNRTSSCSTVQGAFPCSAIGHAFVTFHHGEVPWSLKQKPIHGGYQVSWLPFNLTSMEPTGEYIAVIYEEIVNGNCGADPCLRPVNAVFDLKGHLFTSTDVTGQIYRTTYGTPPPAITKYTLKY